MRIKRLLAVGLTAAAVSAAVLFNAGSAAAAANPCGGTLVGTKPIKDSSTTYGSISLYNTGTSGSTVKYCGVVTRTGSAASTGLSRLYSYQVIGGVVANNRVIVDWSSRNPISGTQGVAHCSTCQPYFIAGTVSVGGKHHYNYFKVY